MTATIRSKSTDKAGSSVQQWADGGSVHLLTILQAAGDVSPARIRHTPFPAKPADVNRIRNREKRLYELVDGVLVEKVMGARESFLALELAWWFRNWLQQHDLGFVLGADGMLRILPDQVRIPDLCFISWERLGSNVIPNEPIPSLAPDLAVEVVSPGNTKAELKRKLSDYFRSGVVSVWFIDTATRSARIYSGPTKFVELKNSDHLAAPALLPGLSIPLKKLFGRLTPEPKKPNKKRR